MQNDKFLHFLVGYFMKQVFFRSVLHIYCRYLLVTITNIMGNNNNNNNTNNNNGILSLHQLTFGVNLHEPTEGGG